MTVHHDIVRPSELLGQLARAYHHVQQEHKREAPGSAARRRTETEMERIARRFERTLARWVPEPELAGAWKRHFHGDGPEPDGPSLAPHCLFRGETEAGSRIEIRPAVDGGYDVFDGGSRIEHHAVPWHLEPDLHEPFHIGDYTCREIFGARPEAIRALAEFVARSDPEPPWRWARDLFEDGLIDAEFGLTPRGRRALSPRTAAPASLASRRASFCVVAADAARARILVLEGAPDAATTAVLTEVSSLVNPARRARDSELFSDTRPGTRRESGHGPRHGVDDRRGHQRQTADRKFAELVAEEAEAVWRRDPACRVVVVAAPRMLGHLRPALARRRNGVSSELHELDKDLSRLAPAALHDALAGAALLPPRTRLPPTPGASYGAAR